MAKLASDRKKVVKRTCQGGSKPKTSSMNKTQKRAYKSYRGQGN
jgi:hypothetical protein